MVMMMMMVEVDAMRGGWFRGLGNVRITLLLVLELRVICDLQQSTHISAKETQLESRQISRHQRASYLI